MFFETSAKSANNVDMAFQAIARTIMEKMANAPAKIEGAKLDRKKITGGVTPGGDQKKSSCC